MNDDVVISSSKIDSMSAAEKECFYLLCNNTNSKPGKNAFIGRLPNTYNAWYFALSEIPADYGNQFDTVREIDNVAMTAEAVGLFEHREDAQRFLMQCITSTPYLNADYVRQLRIKSDGVRELTFQWLTIADGNDVGLWQATIYFDVVFDVK